MRSMQRGTIIMPFWMGPFEMHKLCKLVQLCHRSLMRSLQRKIDSSLLESAWRAVSGNCVHAILAGQGCDAAEVVRG